MFRNCGCAKSSYKGKVFLKIKNLKKSYLIEMKHQNTETDIAYRLILNVQNGFVCFCKLLFYYQPSVMVQTKMEPSGIILTL